jgi:hypothetical protein
MSHNRRLNLERKIKYTNWKQWNNNATHLKKTIHGSHSQVQCFLEQFETTMHFHHPVNQNCTHVWLDLVTNFHVIGLDDSLLLHQHYISKTLRNKCIRKKYLQLIQILVYVLDIDSN